MRDPALLSIHPTMFFFEDFDLSHFLVIVAVILWIGAIIFVIFESKVFTKIRHWLTAKARAVWKRRRLLFSLFSSSAQVTSSGPVVTTAATTAAGTVVEKKRHRRHKIVPAAPVASVAVVDSNLHNNNIIDVRRQFEATPSTNANQYPEHNAAIAVAAVDSNTVFAEAASVDVPVASSTVCMPITPAEQPSCHIIHAVSSPQTCNCPEHVALVEPVVAAAAVAEIIAPIESTPTNTAAAVATVNAAPPSFNRVVYEQKQPQQQQPVVVVQQPPSTVPVDSVTRIPVKIAANPSVIASGGVVVAASSPPVIASPAPTQPPVIGYAPVRTVRFNPYVHQMDSGLGYIQ